MGLHHSPKIVTDGLVLYIDPANPKSYPGSGDVWYDLSGNKNHASLVNSPVFSNGIVTWSGTEYAQVTANQNSLDFRAAQTVIIWMKHSFSTGRLNPWDQAYGGYGTWTHEQGSFISYYYGSSGGNTPPYTSSSSAVTETSVWNCMAVARDDSLVRWYKNGEENNSRSTVYPDQPVTTANIRIGRGYAGYWIGEMGPVLAYNRVLAAEEVKQNYNTLRGRFGI